MSEKMGRKMPQSSYSKAKRIAEETLDAFKALKYKNPSGRTISLDKLLNPAVRRSKLYKPDWEETLHLVENKSPEISVTNESTLEAAERLAHDNPCVLNFASAKHPGGGFLRGSIAQEESIARASALYHTLVIHPEYYEENKRSQKDNIGLYLDYAIYSPDVPVIRRDNGDWLENPYTTSVLTSPAPNRTAIIDDMKDTEWESDEQRNRVTITTEKLIAATFAKRMIQALTIMAANNHRTIVLGAWGCGVFGNNPKLITQLFRLSLTSMPYFDKVVFAIYDSPDSEVFREFQKEFG